MQAGEPIANLVTARSEDCWYCKEPPKESKSDPVEDPSSQGKEEQNLNNDSSKLGLNLGHKPDWTLTSGGEDGTAAEASIVAAAHHLIPGNGSLKKVTGLLKLIYASKNYISKDIGYDINCRQNGIWLPALSKGGWKKLSGTLNEIGQKKDKIAQSAMRVAGAQFHQAHPTYNGRVETTLKAIADKINPVVNDPPKCPICGDPTPESDKKRPPYGLVGRLNALSRLYRKFLTGPVRKWPTKSGYRTSNRSELMK